MHCKARGFILYYNQSSSKTGKIREVLEMTTFDKLKGAAATLADDGRADVELIERAMEHHW